MKLMAQRFTAFLLYDIWLKPQPLLTRGPSIMFLYARIGHHTGQAVKGGQGSLETALHYEN